MTRTILMVFATLALAPVVQAQTPADPIATPLLAAPGNLREGATVIKWKADYTYDTLRKGTNTLVCYDRSGQPLQQPFAVECTMLGNLPRVAQSMKFEKEGGERAKANGLIDAAEKAGTRIKPEFGSVFYNQSGPDREHMRPHMTIAVPMATTKTLGLPEDNKSGGVWIMNAGTTTAHLMVPGE
jgi:hypothetical protein